MDDEKKMLSEFFDSKGSLGFSVTAAWARLQGGLLDYIAAEFLVREWQQQHNCLALAHLFAGKGGLGMNY